ncbi:hypothetical protein NAV33_07285 [Pseudomonas stutzeri]|uniref:hypothetical protein n=1 Tax=Stutzerimonas stutzeri TaxID=316 RepID=UPI002108E2FE|nr:hypothetical protein [Stutzerimonas stutzeri]MCQ4311697.1 hypothetical protein [Stutzerimonas stutzeri]
MKQLIAIHEVVRMGADKTREVIAPKKSFTATEKDAEYLVRVGAARMGAAVTEEPAIAVPASGSTDDTDPKRDLTKLLKPELQEIAKGLEIEGYEAMTVAQLREAIEAEEAAEEDESMI